MTETLFYEESSKKNIRMMCVYLSMWLVHKQITKFQLFSIDTSV